jgi:hypothetical protein
VLIRSQSQEFLSKIDTERAKHSAGVLESSEKTEIVVIQNWEAEALRKHGNVN